MSLTQLLNTAMNTEELFNSDLFSTLPQRFLNELSIPSDSWSPAINIKEEENQYLVIAEVPGVKSEDVDITFDKNSLIIKGEKKSEIVKEDTYHRVETTYGSFSRSFTFLKI